MKGWLGKLKGFPRQWNDEKVSEINALLYEYNERMPSDIHRYIRPLTSLADWKGTEYRTFLLYIGVVALKDNLETEQYEMFLKLFCAVHIRFSKSYAPLYPVARGLFVQFIEKHIKIYGDDSITSNIHHLSHLVDDVEHLGPLYSINAYEFENQLHHLKMRIRNCNLPLQQIARRIQEISHTSKINPFKKDGEYPKLKDRFIALGSPGFHRIERYREDCFFSSKNGQKNRWMILKNNQIVEFDGVVNTENGYMIRGSPLKRLENLFQAPFFSKHLNIFLSDGEKASSQNYNLNAMKAKLFCLPYKTEFVFIPLNHTL